MACRPAGFDWHTPCYCSSRVFIPSVEYENLEFVMSGKTTQLKPGEKAPASGQYQEIGPSGSKGHEVTVVKGEPMPPTTAAGSTYEIVDRTKNKSGQG